MREEVEQLVARLRSREAKASLNEFFAIKDITFSVPTGTVCGIIGRNGSGKTTLLKVLTSITAPDEGEAVMRGRIGSLLEVGAGFHPDLDGIENIYLNGAILGMSKAEITRKLDRIIKFADIGSFLENAGQALFVRHVCSACLRDRCSSGAPRFSSSTRCLLSAMLNFKGKCPRHDEERRG
nr:ATP-binding cassette domain-containing protein [Mesorhizobium ciceri]